LKEDDRGRGMEKEIDPVDPELKKVEAAIEVT